MLFSLRSLYALLAVIGLILPFSQFLPWLLAHGIAVRLFFSDMFANDVAAAFGLDVVVSFCVLCVLIFTEGTRLGMRHLWLPVVGSLIFGVSFGLPLFLYMREAHKSQAASI